MSNLLEEDGDVVVVSGNGGGIDHVKTGGSGGSSGAFEVAAAEAAAWSSSLQEAAAETAAEAVAVASLQTRLDALEKGSSVDVATPKDGHCLFHGLRRGGLASMNNCPCSLSIPELRGMALSMASQEQLTAAAASTDGGITLEEYVSRMKRSEYGDHLIVALLSQVFETPITVISATMVRTWYPDSSEVAGAAPEAIWVAHVGCIIMGAWRVI